jgi:hypothetical protein
MENQPFGPKKKGLSALAWTGIGCAGVIGLCLVVMVVVGAIYGDKIKKFAEDAQQNPTRAAAVAMVTVSAGQLEMVAQDDVNKRYTVREKQQGKLTTIYWDTKKKAPEVIPGDFSAIPADPSLAEPAEPSTPAPPQLERGSQSPAAPEAK